MKTQHAAASEQAAKQSARARAPHPRSVANAAPFRRGESDPDQPFEEGRHDEIDQNLQYRLISEAAFGLYAERGFADGYDVEDWLTAEAQVDHLLLNPQFALDDGGT